MAALLCIALWGIWLWGVPVLRVPKHLSVAPINGVLVIDRDQIGSLVLLIHPRAPHVEIGGMVFAWLTRDQVNPRGPDVSIWRPVWVGFQDPTFNRFYWTVCLPLWIPSLLFSGPSAFAWWKHARRPRPGFCGKCRYDRIGLAPGAVCPECGAASA